MVRTSTEQTTRLTQAERTEISDRKMFDATVGLVSTIGASATSLKDVGVKAGYSRGLASHRFGNKDALFSFVLRRLGEIWMSQLTQAIGSATGLEAVEKAIHLHYQYCVDAPARVQTFYTLWFESLNTDSELGAALQSIHNRRHHDVEQWIVQDPQISPEIKQQAQEIAVQFCASVIGIVYYWLLKPNDLELARTLHEGLKQNMVRRLSNT